MEIPIYQVDAFTDKVFKGNPAAVCPLNSWLDDQILQNIASENNLSETAFFVKTGEDNSHYQLRWFTPVIEIDLCGHATLASGHVLFNHLDIDVDEITFSTKSGELIVSREDNLIRMNFPSWNAIEIDLFRELHSGLGIKPSRVLKTRDILAVFENEDMIRSIDPDFGILKKVDALGIIVTAPGNGVDFVSRFFAPRAGVNEDPVTGSAHSTLVPYWSKRLNKNQLIAEQLSTRGGKLFCALENDRVIIKGAAVTSMTGMLYL